MDSAIIGGYHNKVTGNYSAVIGGKNLQSTFVENVLVPTIMTMQVGGTAASSVCWQLGGVKSGPATFTGDNYIEVSLNGVVYKLALAK